MILKNFAPIFLGCVFLVSGIGQAATTKVQLGAAPEGKLFGVFNFPPEEKADWPFTATRLGGDPAKLSAAASAKMKVLVALTGSKKGYTDSKGCFSQSLWRARLDEAPAETIRKYVESGTIIGLYAIDEPHDWGKSGSCKEVSYTDIDAACGYARQKWPGISCGVNSPPGWLKKGLKETSFSHLGFLFTQYNTSRGNVDHWIDKQLKDAGWFKGKIYLSINTVANSPSTNELLKAGTALCKAPINGVFMWRWPEGINKAGMQETTREIAKICER